MTPAALHRAVSMATRLATTGQVSRARAVIAALPPVASGRVVIEVNATVALEYPSPRARRTSTVPTQPIAYVSLETESEAWVAEYRSARGDR